MKRQKNNRYSYTAYLMLLCLLLCLPAKADIKAQCDTLIANGVDAMWEKQYVQSLELLTEARSIAKKNNWPEQLFKATNNIGNNYYSMLDYGEALKYYLEAYTIAVKQLEPKYEMIVLNNIAVLFSKEKNYEKANEYFKKAYAIAKENKDTVKVGLYAMNLGNVGNETGKVAEAKKYILEALLYLRSEPKLMLLAEIALAENDLLTGDTEKARQKAQSLYRNTKDLDYNDSGLSLLSIITKSYMREGRYAMAANSANTLLALKPNTETKKTVFEQLSEIYASNGDFDKALQYKDSVISAEKQLNDIKNGRLFENSRVKFEIQNYKNEIAIKEEKMVAERKLFYSIIAVIIAIVTIIILALRNISVKHRQKKFIAERNQQVTALELAKEKTENLLLEKQISEKETTALLEQERLKNEIEAKNRKLSAKALYLSGRDELIEEVIASLSQLPELSKNTSLTAHINTLKSHLKTEGEWDSFITHFEEVNHGFISQLKLLHPSLVANDIRFISYIYMNLSTKEIASMLNVTAEACRKRKERIAAKMNLPENVSLYDYLSTL